MIQKYRYPDLPPEDFFLLPDQIYHHLAYIPEEGAAGAMMALIKDQSMAHDIYFYWLQDKTRLVGIVPKSQSEECYFAFWEGTNDEAAHKEIFGAWEQDARSLGFKKIIGPYHFNTFHRYRLRLDKPDWSQFDREPINPPYYPGLLVNLGYQEIYHFESRLLKAQHIRAYYQAKQPYLDQVQKMPYRSHVVDEAFWRKRETEIFELVHAIFSANPGYKRPSLDSFRKMYNPGYARRLCPSSAVAFEDPAHGQLIALCLAQPNYKSLTLTEVPEFDKHYRQLKDKTLLIKTVGVHPDYRQQNLMSLLGAYVMLRLQERYDQCIFCLMRSDNFSLRFSDGLPYEKSRYALYEKIL